MLTDSQKFYRDLDAKKLSPVYFLFGDEPYLLNQCVARFKFAALEEHAIDFNYSLFYAKDADASQVRDVVETLPAFATQRLVILKNLQDFRKESDLETLEPLITNPVPSTVFVMFADKIDKRKKFFKTLIEKAVTVEFKKPYDNQYPQWISHICAGVNLKITAEATHRLHHLVGNNLSELETHIFKIQDYLGEKTLIELADVNAVVSVTREESVFDFTEALGKKDRVNALEQLVNLLDQGQVPVVIIGAVVRHIRILLVVRAGMDEGLGGGKLGRAVPERRLDRGF